MQKIEGVVEEAVVAAALEVVLQRREVRAAVRIGRDALPVDGERVRRQATDVRRDGGKALGPIEPRRV
jgi:hypothetical protein